MTRRTLIKTLGRTFVATCLAGVATVGNAFTLGRHRIVLERVALDLGLGKPLKIVVLGDLHFDPSFEIEYLKKVVARVAVLKPDIVLHTGDFMSHDSRRSGELAEILAPIGGYAALGNHDFWAGADAVTRALETKGNIRVLRNASLPLPGFPGVYVSGLESYWGGKAGPELPPAHAPRIKTPSHRPRTRSLRRPQRPQDPPPGIRTHPRRPVPQSRYLIIAPVLPRWGKRFAYGLFRKDTRFLYVTRGVGTVDLKVRFWCPPEITISRSYLIQSHERHGTHFKCGGSRSCASS